MCFDPLTALAAASALSAYGSLRQGAAAQSAANQNAVNATFAAQVQQGLAERNAQAAERDAAEREQAAAADADRQRTINRLRMGTARANAAASGLQIDGSPLEVLAFNAGQQAQDVEALLLQGRLDARGLREGAALDRWGGENARISGQSQATELRRRAGEARTAGFIGAGSSLLTGASRWQERYGAGSGAKVGKAEPF
jgi:hypothetical protein